MKIKDWQSQATKKLEKAEVSSARLDAIVMLSEILTSLKDPIRCLYL